jgi:hypothetical protein
VGPRPNSSNGNSSTPTWLEGAPPELIEFHAKIRKGRDVLGRLLHDRRMVLTWVHIDRQRKVKTSVPLLPFTYSGLWGAILTALSRANRAEGLRKAGKSPLHAEKKKHALKASKFALQLAAHIEKDGALDFLAHTLFPDGVERLALMVLRDRNLNKVGVSLANTTFVELLVEFQRRAGEIAQTQPIVLRVRAKKEAQKDARPITFVRELHNVFFKHRFGRPMHTAIAAIANVALDLPAHLELTGDNVRRALPRNIRQ